MVGQVDPAWRTSTFSTANGGACVEVGDAARAVMIRDTKQAHLGDGRTVLGVPAEAWTAFTRALK